MITYRLLLLFLDRTYEILFQIATVNLEEMKLFSILLQKMKKSINLFDSKKRQNGAGGD